MPRYELVDLLFLNSPKKSRKETPGLKRLSKKKSLREELGFLKNKLYVF